MYYIGVRLAMPPNPICPIKMMNLTTEVQLVSIALKKESYTAGAPMNREYDLFEKFPDGSSLWRCCVPGLEGARLQLQELARKSKNQFYAIDIVAGKTFLLDREQHVPGFRMPRKSRKRNNEKIA
jgi:hypothetical protein